MADLTGRRLGNYELLGLLGKGGMAAVYRARQINMKRDVAVKVIESDLAQTEEFVRRFEREVETIASFSHPHILKVFDFGRDEGLVYLVMELLPGGSLAEKIRAGAMPLPQVTDLLDQVAGALDYAHNRAVVHRDMKPQNVMLDEAGNAFLTDFGIAKVLSANTSTLSTVAGAIMGTPAYMAPEQWKTQPVDARTDIYALGIILYEMLTGELPFKADTAFGMMHKHVNEEPPIRTFERRFAPGIERVLLKAMAKIPDDRYSSAGSLARDFSAAIDRHGLSDSPFLADTTGDDSEGITLIEIEPEPGDGKDTKRLRSEVGTPLITTIPPASPPPPSSAAGISAAAAAPAPTSSTPSPKQTTRTMLIAGVIVLLAVAGIAFAAINGGRVELTPTSPPASTESSTAVVVVDAASHTPTVASTSTSTSTVIPTETLTVTPPPSETPTMTLTPSRTFTATTDATGTAVAINNANVAATGTALFGALFPTQTFIAAFNLTRSAPTLTYTPTVTYTPSNTATSTATATLTYTATLTATASITATASNTPATCFITVTSTATQLVNRPAADGVGLGFLQRNQRLAVLARSVDRQGTVWLMVTGRVGSSNRTGWIQQRAVRVEGDCDVLSATPITPEPTISPTTLTAEEAACFVTVTNTATQLSNRPAANAVGIGFLQRNQRLAVQARSVDAEGTVWLLVTGRVGTGDRTGWINQDNVRTEGACDALPPPTTAP